MRFSSIGSSVLRGLPFHRAGGPIGLGGLAWLLLDIQLLGLLVIEVKDGPTAPSGLSISKAPLQASTSSWARSGKPSRKRNSSSFHAPRRIFTLPARHCELKGPKRVRLSPLSGTGVKL